MDENKNSLAASSEAQFLRSFQLPESGELYIGRALNNDIVLSSDPLISRQHAKIKCINGKFFIQDLRSSNGSFINKNRLLEITELANKDRLTFGCTRFEFVNCNNECYLMRLDNPAPAVMGWQTDEQAETLEPNAAKTIFPAQQKEIC